MDSIDFQVDFFRCHFLLEEIEQPFLRTKFLLVENQREARIKIGVIAAHALNDGGLEPGLLRKYLPIDLKGQTGSGAGLG